MDQPKQTLEEIVIEALEKTFDVPAWQALFNFVRIVKSHFPAKTTAERAFDEIDPIIQSAGGWKEYFETIEDADQALMQFVGTWPKIRFCPGMSPFENAFATAKFHKIRTERGRRRKELAKYDAFVSLAGCLQVTMGNNPILLPCDTIAKLLTVTPKTVSFWREWAITDGYLVIVKRHQFATNGIGRATTFLFDTRRDPVIHAAAHRDIGNMFDNAKNATM